MSTCYIRLLFECVNCCTLILVHFQNRYQYRSSLDGIIFLQHIMVFSKRINISISPLRLHSASSVQIPSSTTKFNTMLPSIKIRPLHILSASSVNLHGITNSNVFHYNLRIRLSPLKSPILCKYTNPFKRCGMYPSISKCGIQFQYSDTL